MTLTRPLETGYLDDTPVDDTLLRRFLHNQADLAAMLARLQGGDLVRRPDVVVTAFDSPVTYLNNVVPLRPLAGPDDEIVAVGEGVLGARGGVLLSAWPTPDLSRRGWVLVGHPTFVVRGPQQSADGLARGVVVSRVADADELALAERLAVEGYPMPEAVGAPPGSIYPIGALGSALHVFLGRLDGDAVSVAASHVGHGVLNLCLAATLPSARRRGVWQALASARLAEAPHLPAAAVTSDYSRSGFEKLGFLAVSRMTMWAWMPHS